MSIGDQFAGELRRESATTRRVLERVPDAHLAWKPHEKSMSLGQLAFHIAVLPRGITELITNLVTEVRPSRCINQRRATRSSPRSKAASPSPPNASPPGPTKNWRRPGG